MNAIEIKDLCKSFPGFTLDHINMNIEQGSIVGLVGENGAGKSTTIKLLLDLLKPDQGTIRILQEQPDTFGLHQKTGAVLDEAGLPAGLNAVQIGNIMAKTYENWDFKTWNDLLQDLEIPVNRPFSSLSRGMKMKLAIAVALAHKAELLLLDEATSGLDPVAREKILDLLFEYTRDEKHTVLLSSHIISDLEKICDYIAFMHKGKLLLFDAKDQLLDTYCQIQCSDSQLSQLDSSSVLACIKSPYGNRVLVKKENVPEGSDFDPVTLEELFVMMVKGVDGK